MIETSPVNCMSGQKTESHQTKNHASKAKQEKQKQKKQSHQKQHMYMKKQSIIKEETQNNHDQPEQK